MSTAFLCTENADSGRKELYHHYSESDPTQIGAKCMASGTMQIQYSGVNISSLATKAWKELEDVNEKLNGVRSKLRNLPERSRSGNNLSSASAFLRKKQQQFEQKQTALDHQFRENRC